MAEYICTVCGYEGKPVRAINDSAGEDKSFVIDFAEKLIFMMTFLPIKLGWLQKLAKRDKAKNCPNCGVPRMVKLKSDEGWLARRKHDIRSGLLVVDEHGIVRHGEGAKAVLPPKDVVAPADPGKLAAVDDSVWEPEMPEPEAPKPAKEDDEPAVPASQKRVKPVDPDQW